MRSLETDEFQLGVCYYPEHWPEHMWEDDFRRMKEMGFSLVRMAEFAWVIFEPIEGTFSFELFDKAINLARQFNLKVVLGTPTATPPAWLTHKYPEVLNAAQDGTQYQHGQRRHYNYNSPIYRELSARIVTEMAKHYCDHPAVVGWQIDNELNCEIDVFYAQADHDAFREWLSEKYGSLDALNQAWGTVFWSQTYTDWAQVHLTRPTPRNSPNPHQALDEKRFFSDSTIGYAKIHADIIRTYAPQHWITTNGLFGHLNNHQLTDQLLDFISYDSYPNFGIQEEDQSLIRFQDRSWSWKLSVARSVSSNFCVMEQQSGPGGWVNRIEQSSPKPGQLRLWTYQSVAHGADRILYFRWRTATMGTEIYWHGIYDYDNRENRRVKEARQVSLELNRVGSTLVGTRVQSEIAILKDYDNEWDGELDKWHGPLRRDSEQAWFQELQKAHIPVDVLYVNDDTSVADLERYKVLVYPHPAIMSDQLVRTLGDYVNEGGQVVFGCRSGYKVATGQCRMEPMPGPLAKLCGVTVEEFSLLVDYEPAPSLDSDFLSASGFVESLEVQSPGVEALARFSSTHLSGRIALTKRTGTKGTGAAYYFGSGFAPASVRQFMQLFGLKSPISNWASVPADVEVAIRRSLDGQRTFVFLLNYSGEARICNLAEERLDILSLQKINEGAAVLSAYGVWIFEL